ncbi:MAG: RidA family protein [Acidobacteriia bacterium]|nr:RidA family protein [Terriglobia bacterium]
MSFASERRYINLPTRQAPLPFSDAVLVGETLYLAGRIGLDPATGLVPADMQEELNLLFGGLKAVLAQADMTMDDLVWVQVFSSDMTLWERFNVEYLKHFSRDLPARAFLGSGPLFKGARFEINGIAVRG